MKMIAISPETSLFLKEVKDGQITFRTSYNPQHLRTEKFVIKDNICYLGTYHFSADHLNKLQ